MRTAALVCNVILVATLCLDALTEGVPGQTLYLMFTVLALLVPILTFVVLLRGGSARALITRVTVVCNLVLAALTCWAAIAHYPYPEGNGVIPFALLLLLTPIISAVVLLRSPGEPRGQQQVLAHPQ